MIKGISIIITLAISHFAYSQESKAFQDFKKITEELNLNFDFPQGYLETEVIENNDLGYYYAVKHKELKLEIRYTFFSIKDMIERNKNGGGLSADPNKMYRALVSTNQLNLSGGNEYQLGRFDTQSVKSEFNADDGGSTFFPLNSEFGTGYKNCVMVFLHKENIADAFILYLFDDAEIYQNNAESIFYSMTFKP